jgi:hypothetical protein
MRPSALTESTSSRHVLVQLPQNDGASRLMRDDGLDQGRQRHVLDGLAYGEKKAAEIVCTKAG